MTISVGQKFALGPSVTVCFSGEFVWKGHAWARQLISERWKDAPSPVDAAFRYDHNSVLLIKVRTTGPRSGPGQKCWSQHEKPSPRWPLPTGSRFPPPGLSFPEKGQARGVCVCVHVSLTGATSSGSPSVLICVHTSLLLLKLSAILSFLAILPWLP